MSSTKSKFGIGVFIGAVMGGIAAFFLSPKSGPENRKMAMKKFEELKNMLKNKSVDEIAKDIFGKATDEGKKLFVKARDEVSTRLDDIRDRFADIDRDKYTEVVNGAVEMLKKEGETSMERLGKLREYLMKQWSAVQDMAKEDVKKITK